MQKAFVSAGIAPGVVDCGHVKDGKLVVSFILMDFVAGVSLNAWLAEKTRSKKEMDGLFVKLTDVWRKMKKHNLGHDDLHGSNIVVIPNRSGAVKEVKILDFGHAKMQGFNLSVLVEQLYVNLRFFEMNNEKNGLMFRERLASVLDSAFRGAQEFGKALIAGKKRHWREFPLRAI